MPYKKTYRKKKTFRKTYRKKTMPLTKRDYFKLKKLHPPERKFRIHSASATAVNNTGVSYRLNDVDYGTDDNSRLGDKIMCNRLTGNIYVTGITGLSRVRILLYWVNLPVAGALPGLNNDLVAIQTRLTTGRYIDFMSRYKMIRDYMVTLDGTGAKNSVNIPINIKLNKETVFSGATATNIYKNMLALTMFSDTAGTDPSVEHYLNFFFTDS